MALGLAADEDKVERLMKIMATLFVSLFLVACASAPAVEPEAAPLAPAVEEPEKKPCELKDPPDCEVEAEAEPMEQSQDQVAEEQE